MNKFILILITSFLMTVLSTPLIIKFSIKKGTLDYPSDKLLNIHKRPMPILGGLALSFGIISSCVLSIFFFKIFKQEIIGFLIGLLLVFLLGLFDDLKGLKPIIRLGGQFIASFIVISVSKITVNLIPYWYITIPVTILYIMATINSINLLDGIDGLATGTALIASGGFLFAFFLVKNNLGMVISASVLGITAGFLIYNFNPAKIFLGDNGSTMLGFSLGFLAVLFSSKSFSIIHFVVPIFILAIPLLDTGLAISRRLFRHRSIFYGDRDHFYDKLLRKGFTQKRISLITYIFGFLSAMVAISFMLH